MRELQTAALVAGLVLTGCLAPLSPAETTSPTRPVVVAVIDSGINPYHRAFTSSQISNDLFLGFTDATTGERTTTVRLSADPDWDSARESDARFWSSVTPGKLYAFEGTRVLAISFDRGEANSNRLLDSDIPHGTGVAGVVADVAPNALIVMVEANYDLCNPGRSCVYSPDLLEALDWVGEQPWIDVVSTSFGGVINHPSPEFDAVARSTREAVASGKIWVASTSNAPPPQGPAGPAGPTWVIGVGGASHHESGASVLAGQAPDVVANYTATVPLADSRDGTRTASGTSYSAPHVAAIIAKSLDALGADARDETRYVIRLALNASANLWSAGTWRPELGYGGDTSWEALGRHASARSAPVVAPAAQMGWGFVDNTTADEMVRRILEQDFTIPPEKQPHVPAIEAAYRAREEYWRARLGD